MIGTPNAAAPDPEPVPGPVEGIAVRHTRLVDDGEDVIVYQATAWHINTNGDLILHWGPPLQPILAIAAGEWMQVWPIEPESVPGPEWVPEQEESET